MTIAQEKTTEPAPLLTAESARFAFCGHATEQTMRQLEAIASRRVVCIDTQTHVAVTKMTEAEARDKYREAFVSVFGHFPEWSGTAAKLLWNTRWDAHETGYLAALRDLGVILP